MWNFFKGESSREGTSGTKTEKKEKKKLEHLIVKDILADMRVLEQAPLKLRRRRKN